MKTRARGSAAAIAAALITVVAGISSAQAADFSDTFIGFRYGDNYKEPEPGRGAGGSFVQPAQGKIAKEIIQLQHVSGYAYGTNFFNVDMLRSNSHDSATNAAGTAGVPGTGGCTN